jgi:hypothetical protein
MMPTAEKLLEKIMLPQRPRAFLVLQKDPEILNPER